MTVRFYAGKWRDDDGEPISTEQMKTASEPGRTLAEQPTGVDKSGDSRKTKRSKEDPRRDKGAQ